MERFKGYQEDQGSRCKPAWLLLPSVQDRTGEAGGHGGQIAGGSSELGLRQGAHGIEEVWETTWGCSPAADADGGGQNPKGRPAVLAADSGRTRAAALQGLTREGGWRWSCSLALWTCLRRRLAPDASLGSEPDGGNAGGARLLALQGLAAG
jgi:hypothetical protein